MLAVGLSIDVVEHEISCRVAVEQVSSAHEGHEAVCTGRVAARRSHGSSLAFVDLVVEGVSEPVQVVVEGAELCATSAGLALRLGSTIAIAGRCGRTRRGAFSLFASAIRLVRLPPEPTAALRAAQAVACGLLPAATAGSALGCPAESVEEIAQLVEAAEMDCTNAECVQACRKLTAALRGGGGRIRPPRFSAAEHELVARLRAAHCSLQLVRLASLAPLDTASLGPLHPERGLPSGLDAEEGALRTRYLAHKKVPQLRWMLQRAYDLLSDRATSRVADARRQPDGNSERPLRVLDLGCGKADLGLLLAAALPQLRVLCADTNASALQFARERAAAASLSNVDFFHGDASTLLSTGLAPGTSPGLSTDERGRASGGNFEGGLEGGFEGGVAVDLLVGLHACGGLSDVALDIAASHGASALVCMCCYNKHRALWPAERWGVSEDDKSVICRMADACDRRVAEPARELVGCLRLRSFGRSCAAPSTAALHSFDESYSGQNCVLVAKAVAPAAP